MVAPINKNESAKHSLPKDHPLYGYVQKLLGGEHAPPVGPNLSNLLRQILEGKQIQTSTIEDFISRHKSLKRYQSSFHLLWAILLKNGINPPDSNLDQVAQAIIQLFQYSISQARNAYSAMLLIPQFGQLRFHPFLTPYKRLWNQNVEKYGHFWDPLPMLLEMVKSQPLTICDLRKRLIICARLLCLFRSSDFANCKRIVSVIGDIPFIKVKRKGQKTHKFERIVSLPSLPQISPFHLMQSYVTLTRSHGKPGGELLLSLNPPYKPLSSDTIASITKNVLESFNIPSKFWGAHSTRGAGVGLMKRLGLSGEQVCEIGKWKGVEAFVAHYQILGLNIIYKSPCLHKCTIIPH
jgi:hypothetical protein